MAAERNFPNVVVGAIPILVEQLESYGARFTYAGNSAEGSVCEHDSGVFRFRHEQNRLTVQLLMDFGHFPQSLLIGGIRQTVEEAVELVERGFDRCQRQTA